MRLILIALLLTGCGAVHITDPAEPSAPTPPPSAPADCSTMCETIARLECADWFPATRTCEQACLEILDYPAPDGSPVLNTGCVTNSATCDEAAACE